MAILQKLSFKPADEPGATWPAVCIGAFMAFGGILYGYDTGTISGIMAMDYWKELFSTGYTDSKGQPDVSPSQAALTVSILSVGTFFGALSLPFMADFIGRRWTLMISIWVFNLGVIFKTVATALPLFLAGRFFAGLGVGLISALIPLYQSETAPKWIRGAIIGAYQFAIVTGLLLAAVVNNATHKRQDTGSYRIPIAVQLGFSLIMLVGVFVLPESPRYLIMRDDAEKAAQSLSKLRRLPPDHRAIIVELQQIRSSYDAEKDLAKASYLDCFRGHMVKRQLTGMAVQALQQLGGINFIMYYGTQYFLNSGMQRPFLIQMITSTTFVVSTIPGILGVDNWGRRPMLLWGSVGMFVSHCLVGFLGTFTTSQDGHGNVIVHNVSAQKAGIGFICTFIFCFASTWGPLAWVVTGEIFPLRHRARGLSITTATNWLFNWALAYSTPYLVNYGPGYANLQSKVFFIWAAASFISIIFVWFFIYETKGLTLEDVDIMYKEAPSARKSSSWNKTHQEQSAHEKDCYNGVEELEYAI